MKIEKVSRYYIDGHEFETVQQARDYCENNLEMYIRNVISAAGLESTIGNPEIHEIMKVITKDNVRKVFADVLSYDLNVDDDFDFDRHYDDDDGW